MGEIKLVGLDLPNNMVMVNDPQGKIKNLLKGNETIMFDDVKKYLIEFLRSEEKYIKYKSVLDVRFERSVPKEKMQSFHIHNTQKEVSFFMGAKAFVDTILDHRYIYDNKNTLAQLTKKFFRCFYFESQRGMLFFNSDMLVRFCLEYGFEAIAEVFRNSEPLQNINTSNETINDLNKEQRKDTLYKRNDVSYKELQKQFFRDKIEFYKNAHFIEKEKVTKKERVKDTKRNKVKEAKKTVVHYALYYYYLQSSGYIEYFDNHPNGKVSAIDELLEKNEVGTESTKYFQRIYNELVHYKTNRIAYKQVANISFVANTMLSDYPKAKEIALSELKEAQSKHR